MNCLHEKMTKDYPNNVLSIICAECGKELDICRQELIAEVKRAQNTFKITRNNEGFWLDIVAPSGKQFLLFLPVNAEFLRSGLKEVCTADYRSRKS